MAASRNPYALGPTDNARLLDTRRIEIRRVVDAAAPTEGTRRHALLIGDSRSGRTSALTEAARKIDEAGGTLVVELRLRDDEIDPNGLTRALFSAVIEKIAGEHEDPPSWYRAWCNRVYLGDKSPMDARDVVVGAMALAGGADRDIDPAVVTRDLSALSRLAADRGYERIAVLVDDADALLEDTDLTERLVRDLDYAQTWSLVLASRISGAGHLVEASSPVLRLLDIVGLMPFWTLDKIKRCFTAPLEPDMVQRAFPGDDVQFLLDVLRLTSGSPFEIALVARHLWQACDLGEQEHYELTPRILDRVLSDLAYYTGASQDLIAGAEAVRDLPPEKMGSALDLVALSEMTVRQVAIARLLGLPNADQCLSERLLTSDLDEEVERVSEDLAELEALGVIAMDGDDRFMVQGGRAAIVALKYQARAFAGPSVGDKPFGIPFLACVGEPLVTECASRTAAAFPEVQRLASASVLTATSAAYSARLRSGLDANPYVGLDVSVTPSNGGVDSPMPRLIGQEGDVAIALVNLTITCDGDDLNRLEVWSVPPDVGSHEINERLSDAIDGLRPTIAAAEIDWGGAHHVLLRGDVARRALVQLCPGAAGNALHDRVDAWMKSGSDPDAEAAVTLADATVAALRSQRYPDAWATSVALSHLGFVLSLIESQLDRAEAALRESLDRGPGDGWITNWNLANVLARRGDPAAAGDVLRELGARIDSAVGKATITFYVPGVAPHELMLSVSPDTASAVRDLQLAILQWKMDGDAAPVLELTDGGVPPDGDVAKLWDHVRALVSPVGDSAGESSTTA